MRNFLFFSVSPVTVFAVGSLASSSVPPSRLAVGLFGLPVLVLLWAVRVVLPRYFVWAGGFGVSCFAFRAASFFRAAVCAGLFSVLRCHVASNPTLKRDWPISDFFHEQ